MKKVASKQSEEVSQAIIHHLLEPIKHFNQTITSENSKELAYYATISKKLETSFFFAHLYHSCDRELNQHTNGLIQEYFLNERAFEEISEKEIVEEQNRLNHRPRKVLGYKTSAEIFFA